MTGVASSHRHPSDKHHLVRPRWVWGGLVLALGGLGALGVGIAMMSLWLSAVGSGLLAVGVVCSVAGGVMYDAVPHFDAGRELDQVLHGTVHEGVYPGATTHESRPHRSVSQPARNEDPALDVASGAPPPVAPVAGWILLGVAAFLVISQPWFIGHSATGRQSAFRDAGLAIVVGLAGLRIATGFRTRPIAIGLATLGGMALVLGGLLAHHDAAGLAIVEVTCGAVAIIAALAGACAISRQEK